MKLNPVWSKWGIYKLWYKNFKWIHQSNSRSLKEYIFVMYLENGWLYAEETNIIKQKRHYTKSPLNNTVLIIKKHFQNGANALHYLSIPYNPLTWKFKMYIFSHENNIFSVNETIIIVKTNIIRLVVFETKFARPECNFLLRWQWKNVPPLVRIAAVRALYSNDSIWNRTNVNLVRN